MRGRYEEALAAVDPDRDFGDEAFIHESRGDLHAAVAVFDDRRRRLAATGAKSANFGFRIFDAFRASIVKDRAGTVSLVTELRDVPDSEGLYYAARAIAHVGEIALAIETFDRAQKNAFYCFPFFMRDPWIDPLPGDPRFTEAPPSTEKKGREAQRAFEEHPGSRGLRVGG